MPEGGIGRTELLIGLAVIAVLALITLPLMLGQGHDAMRDQVQANVDKIRLAELANMEAFDTYLSAASSPRAPEQVDGEAVKWNGSAGFVELSWNPENVDEVYGSYTVAATATGFVIKGTCDLDADGRRATFVATEEKAAEMTSQGDVY